jgi:signal transduction histidine kinase
MTKSRRKRAIYPDWDRHRLIRLFSLWLLVLVIPLGPARAGEVTVRVGVYDNAPIVFPDGSGGYRGLAVEMLQDIASREDWKLEYVGIILGYAEMVRDDVPPGSTMVDDLDKVIAAGNRAKELVQQILVFSRQETVERFPLRLQPLVKEGLKMLRASIPTTIDIQDDIDFRCGFARISPLSSAPVIVT